MITLNVIGLDETIAKLDKLADSELKTELSGILEAGAKQFVANAKRDAAVNKKTHGGNLRLNITYEKIDDLHFEVISAADYSAYVEFGTIKYVFFGEPWLTEEDLAYAAQFRGRGIRKTGGLYPQPFFFKQKIPIEKYLNQLLENFVKDIKL